MSHVVQQRMCLIEIRQEYIEKKIYEMPVASATHLPDKDYFSCHAH